MKKSGFSFLKCYLYNLCFSTQKTEWSAAFVLFKIKLKMFLFCLTSKLNITLLLNHLSPCQSWRLWFMVRRRTSPRFLCSSVSSSWCLILIWAISCCRASLRLESAPELKQEQAQVRTRIRGPTLGQQGHLIPSGGVKTASDHRRCRLTWDRAPSGPHTCQSGTSLTELPADPTSPVDGYL